MELTVADNGTGIPEGFDFRKPGSLGLELVVLLAEKQLGGKIELNETKGTEFKITFKGLKYTKRI
jgi:two-component sensor histidine kinase